MSNHPLDAPFFIVARRWTDEMSTLDRSISGRVAEDALRTFEYPVKGVRRTLDPLTRWGWSLIDVKRRVFARWRAQCFRLQWLRLWWMRWRARWSGVR